MRPNFFRRKTRSAAEVTIEVTAGDDTSQKGSPLHDSLEKSLQGRHWKTTFKDIPRLVRRVTVLGGAELTSCRTTGSSVGILEQVCALATDVAQVVERPARASCVVERIARFLKDEQSRRAEDSNYSFGELEAGHLLEKTLGLGSRTARLLKLINQGVVLEAMFHIKTNPVTSSVFASCKDIRELRGWQIEVDLREPRCPTITHTRRELCGHPIDPASTRYECEWQIQLIFDRNIDIVESVDLRVSNVEFGSDVAGTTRESVSRALGHGSLIAA